MDSIERKYQNFLQEFLAKEESNPILNNLQQAAAINNIFLITREVISLFRYCGNEDKALKDLASEAFKLFCLLEQFKTKLFEDKANEFFSQVLEADSFTLLYKLTERQQGNQVIVKSKKGDESKFYLKTHYNGENENDLWIPQQIDLSEILVYKFLELEGIGPQAFFFFLIVFIFIQSEKMQDKIMIFKISLQPSKKYKNQHQTLKFQEKMKTLKMEQQRLIQFVELSCYLMYLKTIITLAFNNQNKNQKLLILFHLEAKSIGNPNYMQIDCWLMDMIAKLRQNRY